MAELEKIETRKIVPVAAKISAGKSQLLNVLYNMNLLECKTGIATKFINLIRYRPDIKQPCFYHLIVKKEGEKYLFYKDNKGKIYEGEENIIQANKDINNSLYNEKQIKYEDLFYLTEINTTPFIKDKEYLLTHDLCDIPGLSEYQNYSNIDINVNNKKEPEEKKDEIKNNKDELEEIKEQGKKIGLVCDYHKDIKSLNLQNFSETPKLEKKIEEKEEDNEDEIFNSIKDDNEKKTYLTEIFKIIKNFIEGAIIILSVDKYQSKDNYLLIAKLHKVIQKPISNFLIILNKIDLSENPAKDINECKGLFTKYFPKFKTFNLNLNTFVPISVHKLKNELLMNKKFKNLIYYHFYNYMSKLKKYKEGNDNNLGDSFIDHLKNILKKNNLLKIDKIEAKVNEINNSENIAKINEEIIVILNELKDNFKDNDQNLNLGIVNDDFNNNNIIENNSDSEEEDDNNNKENKINNINPAFIIKYFYVSFQDKNKELMPPISEETIKLLNYFRNSNKIKHKIKEEKESNEKTLLNKKIIKILTEIKTNITTNFTFDIEVINNLIKEIANTIETLKTYNVIFIPFLGEINSGKSTILNGIIGENILPTGLKECTKRGIIIRYTNNKTSIGKANFKNEKINNNIKYYFEAEDEDIIGSGIEQVRDVLKGLNYDFNEKEEDSFYYIKTRIRLFDEIGLDNSLKKMIYLIDLPGFGTENIFQKKIYLNLMTICNTLIFVVKDSIIKEDNKKEILDKIYHKAKEKKEILASFLMKSSLFIFNNTKDQTFKEDDIIKAKNDIMELINVKENINLCFFNAKRHSLYIDNYNYYFNIEETLKNEYQNYLKDNRDSYMFPEITNSKKYDNFLKYLNNKLDEKNSKLF